MGRSENIRTLLSLITTTTEDVSLLTPEFHHDDVLVALMRTPTIKALLKAANPIIREIALEWLDAAVGRALQVKDAWGLRVYENYPTRGVSDDGYGGARRWLRTKAQDAEMFRRLAEQPERQEREHRVKKNAYTFISDQLDKRSRLAGRKLVLSDVENEVGPMVLALRARQLKEAS